MRDIKIIKYNSKKKISLYNLLNNKYSAVVINEIFSEKETLKARLELINFFNTKGYRYNSAMGFFDSSVSHRWDNNSPKLKYKRVMKNAKFKMENKKLFKNCINILKKSLKLKIKYHKDLKKINKNEPLRFKISPRGSFYPSGGGHYEEHNDLVHADKTSGEKVVDIIPLSEIKRDYQTGGFAIRNKNKLLVNVEKYMKLGSVVFIRSKTNHKVQYVDIKEKINKKSHKGRFSLLSVMIAKNKKK